MTTQTLTMITEWPIAWGQILQFWDAGVTALITGTEADLIPDCGCDMPWTPWWCDDCDTWHGEWTGVYPAVREGQLWAEQHSCDTDGNWEWEDCAIWGSEEHKQMEEALKRMEGQDIAYVRWVARNGSDPLNQFYVKASEKVEVDVVAFCIEEDGKGRITDITIGGTEGDPRNLPQEVKDFFLCDERGLITDPHCGWDVLCKLDNDWARTSMQDYNFIAKLTCKVDMEKPIPHYEDRLIRAAFQSLHRRKAWWRKIR